MPLPIAAAAAANPELVNKAASGIGKAVKVIGIAIGVGLATFIIVKVVKKAKGSISAKSDIKKDAEEHGYKQEEKKLKDSDISQMVKNLKSAFKGSWGYDEDAIRGELSKLQNKHDWYALDEAFNVMEKDGEYWRLVDWLNDDDASDRKTYREILDKIEVTGILKL